jgi:hypothetical protein
MTLWVFGDSFAHDIKDMEQCNAALKKAGQFPLFFPLEKNWVNLVSEKLTGTVEHKNFAVAGCANEFIFHQLMQNIAEFKEGDYVIVSFTANSRRWLVERCPHLANWSHCKFEPDTENSVTKDENAAILQYGRHLHSEKAANAIYDAIFWATVHAAHTVAPAGVRVLILPGFHKVDGVFGTLTDVCFGEFDNEKTLNSFYLKTNDCRWNHLTEVNHNILAEKICNFFIKGEIVDLTSGFEKKIYTKNNI